MPEKFFQPEQYIEAVESVSYKEFLEAQKAEEELMKQWEEILAITPDRREAERAFLENLAPKIQAAKEKTARTLHDWLSAVDDSHSE